MASEELKIDGNNKNVSGAVTDDSNQFIKMLRIDDTTKGLKVSIVGGGGSGTVTSVSGGTGIVLTPDPIVTTGTVALITSLQPLATLGTASQQIRVNAGATALEYFTPAAASLTVGSTTIASGTTTRILYDNAGVLGEYTISGTGNVAMTTSPVFTTPNIGSATGSISGNAGTATALQNARTIGGVSFDGTGNIVPQTIQSVNEATDTTCFPLFISASGSQSLQPLNNTNLTFNSNTAILGSTIFNAGTGFQIGGAASSGKILKANGTNFVASTETYAAPGTSGNIMTSDGTNWTSATPSGGVSLTALESGSTGDVLVTIIVGSSATALNTDASTDFGKSTTSNKKAFQVVGNGVSMSSLKVNLKKVASPTNNTIIRIETDNAGVPSGTLANANATASISSAGLTTSYVDTTVTFAGSFTLTNGTPYWLVFGVDASPSNTNYLQVGNQSSSTNANNGTLYASYNAVSWSANDHTYGWYVSAAAGIYTAGVLKNRSSANSVTSATIGLANANYTMGNSVSIASSGQVCSGMSGLIPGYYYPPEGGTPGSLAAGTLSPSLGQVGVALSTTSMFVFLNYTSNN